MARPRRPEPARVLGGRAQTAGRRRAGAGSFEGPLAPRRLLPTLGHGASLHPWHRFAHSARAWGRPAASGAVVGSGSLRATQALRRIERSCSHGASVALGEDAINNVEGGGDICLPGSVRVTWEMCGNAYHTARKLQSLNSNSAFLSHVKKSLVLLEHSSQTPHGYPWLNQHCSPLFFSPEKLCLLGCLAPVKRTLTLLSRRVI